MAGSVLRTSCPAHHLEENAGGKVKICHAKSYYLLSRHNSHVMRISKHCCQRTVPTRNQIIQFNSQMSGWKIPTILDLQKKYSYSFLWQTCILCTSKGNKKNCHFIQGIQRRWWKPVTCLTNIYFIQCLSQRNNVHVSIKNIRLVYTKLCMCKRIMWSSTIATRVWMVASLKKSMCLVARLH